MASVRQVFIRNCQTYTYMYNCIPTYPQYMRTKIGVSSKATDSNSCINSCNSPHEDKADGLNTHWQEMESWRRVRRGEKLWHLASDWLTRLSIPQVLLNWVLLLYPELKFLSNLDVHEKFVHTLSSIVWIAIRHDQYAIVMSVFCKDDHSCLMNFLPVNFREFYTGVFRVYRVYYGVFEYYLNTSLH